MMKILITGGAGLVGSHAAEHFAADGHQVVVFDNLMRSQIFGYNKESVEHNWQYLSKLKNIECIRGDIRNDTQLKKAFGKGVDVVIHAAAQPGVLYSMNNPLEDFSINVSGTLNVLEHTREICKNATFIYCSTNKVYGENVSKLELEELATRYIYKGNIRGISEQMSTDLTGHTPYGVSKLAGDMYVQDYAHIFGMRTAVFRMSCIYGKRQFGFEDQGWLAWFAIATLFNRLITIYGDGKQVRDVLYVDDLIAAYEAFINSDLKSGVFNVGGGTYNTISLIEYIEDMNKILNKRSKILYSDWRPNDQKVYVSDLGKIQSQLNWKPRICTAVGIKKMTDWITDNLQFFA